MTTCFKQSLIFMFLSVLVIGAISPSHAVIVKDGSGTVVFWDDFESASELAPSDADPVAQVGSWQVSGEIAGNDRIQVTNASSPGAAEGSKYLKQRRDPSDTSNLALRANFSQTVVGGTVNLSMMRYYDSTPGSVGAIYEYFKVIGANGTQRIRMFNRSDVKILGTSRVELFHLGLKEEDGLEQGATTGLYVNMDEWVQIDIAMNLDTQTYLVQAEDSTGISISPTFGFYQPGNDVSRIDINGQHGWLSYYDAVDAAGIVAIPEPCTVALCSSLAVFFGMRFPKRRQY